MPTHDYVIDNQTAPNFRADLNSALQAIVSTNSSTSAPATTYANMMWYDTTNNLLRMRNEADDAWITLGTLDQVSNTFSAAAATNAANLTGTSTSNIQSSALATGTANSTTFLRGDRTWQTLDVTPTTAQVLSATAGASVGAVGTYATLRIEANESTNEGGTRAGSQLRYTDTLGILVGGTPSGTWRAMGRASTTTSGGQDPQTTSRVTIWLRIS
jgi:hypothetical protein